MQYVPPLRVLSELGEIARADGAITLPLEAFYALLRGIYEGEAFDAAWYRRTYPDVAAAIADGTVPDELTHFIRFGYLEHRRPRAFDVDAKWYEDTYKDVARAIRGGVVADARSHFNNDGYYEPRAPEPNAARVFAHLFETAAARSAALATPPAEASPSSAHANRKRNANRGSA